MLVSRWIAVFVASCLVVFSADRCALAEQGPDTRLDRVEGPEPPTPNPVLSADPGFPPPLGESITDDPAFSAYEKLYESGIMLSITGGAVVIAGAVLMATALTKDCSSDSYYDDDDSSDGWESYGCGMGAAVQGLIGGTVMSAGGLLLLTPGIIMAVTGQKKMGKLLERSSGQTGQISKRPKLQGVSLFASTTGNKAGGLAVKFSF